LLSSNKIVGATGLGGLWALEWAWHAAETNLRCPTSNGYKYYKVFEMKTVKYFLEYPRWHRLDI